MRDGEARRSHADLIEACVEAPEDDGARLVLADAIGGERGEFIVVQCALARGGLSQAQAGVLRRRQRALIEAHGVAWAGLGGLAKRVTFRRGFVDSAMIEAPVLLAETAAIFAAAPLLRHLAIAGLSTTGRERGPDPAPMLRALFARAELDRIVGLHLDSIGSLIETGRADSPYRFLSDEAEAFEIILASGVLPQLRALAISTLAADITARLVGSGQLRSLERFRGGDLGVTLAVVAQAPRIRALELPIIRQLRDFSTLPPLTELRIAGLTDQRLAALVASPCGATLERLTLYRPEITDPAPLAELAALRSLRVDDFLQANNELFAVALPALRELGVSHLLPAAARAIAHRLGPQLELLDLRGSAADLHGERAELQQLVAGDLLTGAPARLDRLIFLGAEPREPLWDTAVVELPR